MTTLDLHPEELFDKAAAGSLSDSERTYLDSHLAQCEVCRFEQQVRADFLATPDVDLNLESLVTRALAGMPTEKTFSRSRRRSISVLAGGALVFSTMASFAAVAQWTGVWPKVVQAFSAPTPVPEPVAAPRKHLPVPLKISDEKIEVAAPALVEEAPAPVVVVTPKHTVRPAPPPPVVVPQVTAAMLFDQANRARVDGQHDAAVGGYRALLDRFPAAAEANLARATLGRLLLDTGDAAGSLVQLDSYLRSGELTLREEVLSARALALSRLSRPTEEAAAWTALLDAYPGSIHAARARARLEELGQH